MKRCDLHCHSSFSDGSMTPSELIKLAEKQGLSALALTDHNTARGLAEFMHAGSQSSVIPVPGCEFTTEFKGIEIHIVGLFLPQSMWVEVDDFTDLMRIAKHNSNLKMLAALQRDGYDVSYEEAAALTDGSEFNRNHVARVLVQKGIVSSIKAAFETLLKEGNGYYTPAKKLSSVSAIRFIKQYGGIAVLAHPYLTLTQDDLLEFLPLAKEAGLDAIETIYSEFDEATTKSAVRLAEQFALKQSGGSDFHGEGKPKIKLGTGYGNLAVPFTFYQALCE